MKVKYDEVKFNGSLLENEMIFSMETGDEKELLKKIFLNVVGEYVEVDFNRVKSYINVGLDNVLIDKGGITEFRYIKASILTNSDIKALAAIFSLIELMSDARTVEFWIKEKSEFQLTMQTEKGKITFETYREIKNSEHLFGDIDFSFEENSLVPCYEEYGFVVRRV